MTTKPLVINGTPWEQYDVQGRTVYVKREDLSCPAPGPSFSKLRGVAKFLARECGERKEPVVGVMDTRHSKAGWGAAYVCRELGVRCIDFYPVLKADNGQLRPNQVQAQSLGAELHPMGPFQNKAGRLTQYPSYILYGMAKKWLESEYGPEAVMLPNALKLEESIEETYLECRDHTPDYLRSGTWLFSISSGTIAAGAIRWLGRFDNVIYLHQGYSRKSHAVHEYVIKAAGLTPVGAMVQVDEGYSYGDEVDNTDIPFPCNEYYDAKAWRWMVNNIHEFDREPLVFWNVGA